MTHILFFKKDTYFSRKEFLYLYLLTFNIGWYENHNNVGNADDWYEFKVKAKIQFSTCLTM